MICLNRTGRLLAFALAGKTPLEANEMSTIRLEHDNFSAAPLLAELLTDRLLTVTDTGSEPVGDLKSTTYVCSAAYEESIGG